MRRYPPQESVQRDMVASLDCLVGHKIVIFGEHSVDLIPIYVLDMEAFAASPIGGLDSPHESPQQPA